MEAATLVESASAVRVSAQWPLLRRVAFRFCFAYFVLFCLTSQIVSSVLQILFIQIPDPGMLQPVRTMVLWVAKHVFGTKSPLVYAGTGSGDRLFDWVLAFCVFMLAALATAAWSALDRKRPGYDRLQAWFLLFLRVCLCGQMLVYGFIKAFPLQMPYPGLSRLVENFGDLSPMGVLWASVGAAPVYESILGCAELLGGVLLMFPRTITLGALVCLVDMTQVFLLNMTYDVPVKLLSFHLVLISLLLLTPDAERLMNFFVWNRPARAAVRQPLFESRRAQRIAGVVLAAFWLWMACSYAYDTWNNWNFSRQHADKSPLYGIWNIQDMTIDGKPQPLLVNNAQEWRGVVFDYPGYAEVEQMSGSRGFGVALNAQARTLTMTELGDPHWKGQFHYDRSSFDRLTLAGNVNGQAITMHLTRVDETRLLLPSRGFHWVQDYPFNR